VKNFNKVHGIVFELRNENDFMKYRVEFKNKKLKAIEPTQQDVPVNDTFIEENTGATIWAIIDAPTEEEARTKAARLETELQT
jgi:hypothetical protein